MLITIRHISYLYEIEMSKPSSGDDFILFMFSEDYDRICKWVLKYRNSETGGDLFGLWAEGSNSVVHIVLGPGQNCTHGEYHFYQDVQYLKEVGGLLAEDYMLCHIGEWHSHHRLRLCEPSEGDCGTVKRNFPTGACGFLLLIANIISDSDVSVYPYLFKEGSYTFKSGNIELLDGESPFRLVPKIRTYIKAGEEITDGFSDKLAFWKRKGAKPEASNSTKPTKETEKKGLNKRQPKEEPTNVSYNSRSTQVPDAKMNPERPPASLHVSSCTRSYQWYRNDHGQTILREIEQHLKCLADEGAVTISRDSSYPQDLLINFHLYGSRILIKFPFNFLCDFAVLHREELKPTASRTDVFFISYNSSPEYFVNQIREILLNKSHSCSNVNARGEHSL